MQNTTDLSNSRPPIETAKVQYNCHTVFIALRGLFARHVTFIPVISPQTDAYVRDYAAGNSYPEAATIFSFVKECLFLINRHPHYTQFTDTAIKCLLHDEAVMRTF